MAAALLPFTEVRFDVPWSPEVVVADSSVSGFAVHRGAWSTSGVEAVGRWSERWRFRLQDVTSEGPRSRAGVLPASAAWGAGAGRG